MRSETTILPTSAMKKAGDGDKRKIFGNGRQVSFRDGENDGKICSNGSSMVPSNGSDFSLES